MFKNCGFIIKSKKERKIKNKILKKKKNKKDERGKVVTERGGLEEIPE